MCITIIINIKTKDSEVMKYVRLNKTNYSVLFLHYHNICRRRPVFTTRRLIPPANKSTGRRTIINRHNTLLTNRTEFIYFRTNVILSTYSDIVCTNKIVSHDIYLFVWCELVLMYFYLIICRRISHSTPAVITYKSYRYWNNVILNTKTYE